MPITPVLCHVSLQFLSLPLVPSPLVLPHFTQHRSSGLCGATSCYIHPRSGQAINNRHPALFSCSIIQSQIQTYCGSIALYHLPFPKLMRGLSAFDSVPVKVPGSTRQTFHIRYCEFHQLFYETVQALANSSPLLPFSSQAHSCPIAVSFSIAIIVMSLSPPPVHPCPLSVALSICPLLLCGRSMCPRSQHL